MLTRVVKIGGNALDRPEWVAACARALAGLGPSVVVHGGGQAVSAWARRLGLPVEQRGGFRGTTPGNSQLGGMGFGGAVNPLPLTPLRAPRLGGLWVSRV